MFIQSIINYIKKPICPMCFKKVSELKPNCHVYPRWACKLTKCKQGKNTIITEKDGVKEKNQSDITGDYWCEKCEKVSSKYDTDFSKVAYSQKFKTQVINGHSYSIYQTQTIEPVKLYKIALLNLIRYYLYKKRIKEKPCFSYGEFLKLRKDYLSIDPLKTHNYEVLISDIRKDVSILGVCRLEGADPNPLYYVCGGFEFAIWDKNTYNKGAILNYNKQGNLVFLKTKLNLNKLRHFINDIVKHESSKKNKLNK